MEPYTKEKEDKCKLATWITLWSRSVCGPHGTNQGLESRETQTNYIDNTTMQKKIEIVSYMKT